MAVFKRKNKWWICISYDGRRYRKPSPANTKAGAMEFEAHLRQKLGRGESLEKEKKPLTFEEYIPNWFNTYVKNNNKPSEVASKEIILRVHLIPFFGKMQLEKIKNFEIEKYKARKIADGLHPKTVNNHLTVLRTSLLSAVDWELLKDLPAVKWLKIPPQKFDFLTLEESERLINAADGVWRDLIEIALGTGLRFGELMALNWKNIDMDNREIAISQAFSRGVLGSPKNNRIRRVPMTARVYEILEKNQRRQNYIFEGNPNQIACIKKLHRICRKAGLRKIGWHTLRHTFASHLAQSGANLVAIQNLLGHSDIRTTMRYAHINRNALQTAISLLDREPSQEINATIVPHRHKIHSVMPVA